MMAEGGQTEQERLRAFVQANPGREIVVVQGIGFVGSAMLAAIAKSRRHGQPRFAVIGVDLPDPSTIGKVHAVRAGHCPVVSSDPALAAAYQEAVRIGNMTATTDASAFALADVVVMDINLDVQKGTSSRAYAVSDGFFRQAVAIVAERIREDTLVIVETTVPPGTTERIVKPIISEAFQRRRLDTARIRIAHSYERVMPGPNYLSSITDNFRVFAANDPRSRERSERIPGRDHQHCLLSADGTRIDSRLGNGEGRERSSFLARSISRSSRSGRSLPNPLR